MTTAECCHRRVCDYCGKGSVKQINIVMADFSLQPRYVCARHEQIGRLQGASDFGSIGDEAVWREGAESFQNVLTMQAQGINLSTYWR